MLAVRVAMAKAGAEAKRTRYIEAHKAHLRSGAIDVILSGPIIGSDGNQCGAMVVAEVSSLEDFREFSAGDPLVVHGIYGSIEIYEWRTSMDNR